MSRRGGGGSGGAGASASSQAFALVNVVEAFGVDNTGATDGSAAIQAAFNSLAGTGQAAWFPKGTYHINATVNLLPSALVVVCERGVTFVGNIPGVLFNDVMFYAATPAPTNSTTLNGNVAAGAKSFVVTSATGFAVGAIVQLEDAASGNRVDVFAITSVAGTTIGIDRPLRRLFLSGDTVNVLPSVVHDVHFYGNGAVVTGTCARYFEFTDAQDCSVENFRADMSSGTFANNIAASFDNGCLRCFFRHFVVDGAFTGATDGLTLESNTDSGIEDCQVTRVNGVGVNLYDCVGCWLDNVTSENNTSHGCQLGSDGNALGCTWISIKGGHFDANGGSGLQIGTGTSEVDYGQGLTCNWNAGTGVAFDNSTSRHRGNGFTAIGNVRGYVSVTGVEGATIANCDLSGNSVGNLQCAGDLDAANVYMSDAVCPAAILVTGGIVKIRGLYCSTGTTGNNLCEVSGGTLDVTQASFIGKSTTQLIVDTGALCKVSHSTFAPLGASGTEHGMYTNGGTLRIGEGVDASACANPLTNGGGFINRKGTVTGAPGGTAVSWPNLKSTDVVELIPRAAVFTGFVSAYTPGTGFTVTDAASGTYEYFIP